MSMRNGIFWKYNNLLTKNVNKKIKNGPRYSHKMQSFLNSLKESLTILPLKSD